MARVLLAVLVLCAALLGWLRWREGPLPAPVSSREPAPLPDPEAPAAPETPSERAVEPSPALRPQHLADRRDLGTGEAPELLARLPTQIDYPLQEKYRGERSSEVPYELVAAHDGAEAHEGEGARRLFIAVVEPGLPDRELERLVRDLRARHREAEVLRVRVFDSREAATTPSWTDGGAARKAHLVADLYREPGKERFLVRGREVRP